MIMNSFNKYYLPQSITLINIHKTGLYITYATWYALLFNDYVFL